MTIWILCLVLMACSAGMSYQQGAIRAGFSFLGILMAALLSPSLAGFVKPVLKLLGMTHPVLLWMIAPLLVFIAVLAAFKSIGYFVHHKVEVHYKYKAGDLRLALWERLNGRIGLWAGLANGLAYFVIVAWVIYALGYWSVQVAPSSDNSWWLRSLNRLSKDLQKSGASKAAAALDRLPENYYAVADVAGLVFQNSLLEARLSRYPAFLSLGERDEFQAIGNDQALLEMRLRNAPVRELLASPQVDRVIRNPETLGLVWNAVMANLKDLRGFLETGNSPKFDSEPIHGRWSFDLGSSMLAYRREKPNTSQIETQKIRQWMTERFSRTTLVAAPDHQVFIKEYPQLGPQPTLATQTLQGEWKGGDGDYLLTLSSNDERTARVENGKLHMRAENLPLVFDKEE